MKKHSLIDYVHISDISHAIHNSGYGVKIPIFQKNAGKFYISRGGSRKAIGSGGKICGSRPPTSSNRTLGRFYIYIHIAKCLLN